MNPPLPVVSLRMKETDRCPPVDGPVFPKSAKLEHSIAARHTPFALAR
jgi:hypothetical protein